MMADNPETTKQVDIAQMTVTELKALAFDQIMLRDQAQANLNAILAEIQKRNSV